MSDAKSAVQVGELVRQYCVEQWDSELGPAAGMQWVWRVEIWMLGDRYEPRVWRVETFKIKASMRQHRMRDLIVEDRLCIECRNADWGSMGDDDLSNVLVRLSEYFSEMLGRELVFSPNSSGRSLVSDA